MLGITSIYESMKVYNAENYIAFLTGNLGTSIKSAGLVFSHKVAFVPKPVKAKYICAAWYQCHFTLIWLKLCTENLDIWLLFWAPNQLFIKKETILEIINY